MSENTDKRKRDEEELLMDDTELEALFKETHFVEFDRFGSCKTGVSFSQVKLASNKLSHISQILKKIE